MMALSDQMHRPVAAPALPQRIISLVPSQTELLFDLGVEDRVVGITKFCIHPAEWFRSKPRVGGTKKVDIDKVRALEPDLIIGNKEENARADIEALEQEFPVWMSDINDLDGALDMIRRVGELTGTAPKAEAIATVIAAGFAALLPDPHGYSVAYLIWRDPWMAAGPGTFIHDMLRRCGHVNAFAHHSERYPEVSPAELAAADPDLVFLSSEPYPFSEKHIAEVAMVLPGAPVRLVDGEPFSWYGSRLLRSPAYFSGLSPV
ncbi:MAG: helical backbone metal receptor [Flavobacteriales bacterium]|jgi:ABC-type Fe3+-hydroxamate transport system substrate-binding protein|nr:helical backbone metal receptor [Flavobacteriales bacterium]